MIHTTTHNPLQNLHAFDWLLEVFSFPSVPACVSFRPLSLGTRVRVDLLSTALAAPSFIPFHLIFPLSLGRPFQSRSLYLFYKGISGLTYSLAFEWIGLGLSCDERENSLHCIILHDFSISEDVKYCVTRDAKDNKVSHHSQTVKFYTFQKRSKTKQALARCACGYRAYWECDARLHVSKCR